MVSSLPKFRPSSQDTTARIRGRFYGTRSTRGVAKVIHTQVNPSGRSPRLDLLMAGNGIQPNIHNGLVTITHRNKRHGFYVFVKNHCQLDKNKAVRKWGMWRGDIVVMKKGLDLELVNMNRGDERLADFAVKKFVQRVTQKSRFYIPKTLKFCIP